MWEHLINAGELILLIVIALLNVGRWSKDTENKPSEVAQIAKEALAKAESTANDLRSHKHAWQAFLNGRFTELDAIYARKREVELQLETIQAKLDADCDRITVVEQRFHGV